MRPSIHKRCEVDGEDVGLDDFDVGPPSRRGRSGRFGGQVRGERARASRGFRGEQTGGVLAEIGGEGCVSLDGDDAARVLREKFGHFAVARADFEPGGVCISGKRTRDAFAPRGTMKKVLAKFLTRHKGSEFSRDRRRVSVFGLDKGNHICS